jgi:hypothetical protein
MNIESRSLLPIGYEHSSDTLELRDTLLGTLYRAIGSLLQYRGDGNPPPASDVVAIIVGMLGDLALAIPPQTVYLDPGQAEKIARDNSTITAETGELDFFDLHPAAYEREVKPKITGPFEEHVEWPCHQGVDKTNTLVIERRYLGPLQGNQPVGGVTLIFKRHGAEGGE